ncbi:MAG: BrnA antitoxin family protein [candidate division KSB1 bacterium]|nr:BrnA antitoxin family protein [candidate division KSB1 bacterium]MDZ7368309.1 BrnA antitoxin family protein [candidate division KSB1 bacterium]MDZ7406111.1 BrnA antitoxin family protein [candidate division KSB1 bacterium]
MRPIFDCILHFKSLEEEVEFWETHSLTDYRDYWREVKDVKIDLVPRRLSLEDELAQRINEVAPQRGVSSETLVNLWLQQKLSEALKREKRRQKISSRRVPTCPKSDFKKKIWTSQYA